MKIDSPSPTRADAALLRNTVLKLTAVSRAITVVAVILAVVIWWFLLHRVIAFGKGLDYSGLESMGGQVKALVQQYNPFFWWAVVALCTLIIAYFLFGFVRSMNRTAKARRVDADIVAKLVSKMTPAAVGVLHWSWQNRREPITVGVLQRTLSELQTGRAARISLVEQHAALLDKALAPVVHLPAAAPANPSPPLPTSPNYG